MNAPLPLSGLLLHASRCGSTLVARALAGVAACHMVAEPAALNHALNPVLAMAAGGGRMEALARVMAELGHPRQPGRTRFIVKATSWNARHLPVLETLWPDLPKVFITREPLEILVSSLRDPPSWLRWADHPASAGLFLNIAPSAAATLSPLEFVARTLGGTMAAVAASVERAPAEWCLVDHTELPGAIVTRIAPHLKVPIAEAEKAALDALCALDAKRGDGRVFVPDSADKRDAATDEVRAAAERWMAAPFARLRQARAD